MQEIDNASLAAANHGKRPKDGKRLTVELPRDLHRRLKIRATERDVSMAAVLREVLTEWLDRQNA